MKIISIETFTNEYIGLVRVRTDKGDEGWGQELAKPRLVLSGAVTVELYGFTLLVELFLSQPKNPV